MKTLNAKKKAMAISLFTVLLVVLFAVAWYFLSGANSKMSTNDDGVVVFNEDGTVTLPLGAVQFGVHDVETGAVINAGGVLVPLDGRLRVNTGTGQHLDEDTRYVLIVLVNNEQRTFIHEGREYKTYAYTLAAEDEYFFDIEVPIDEDADREVIFVFFQNPDFNEVPSDDYLAAAAFKHALSQRYFIGTDTRVPFSPDYWTYGTEIDYAPDIPTMFLTDDAARRHVAAAAIGGETLQLILSNYRDHDIIYALGSFLDWKQYPFSDGDLIKYIHMPAQSTRILDFTVPTVTERAPFQVFIIANGVLTKEIVALHGRDIFIDTCIRVALEPAFP